MAAAPPADRPAPLAMVVSERVGGARNPA